MRQFTPITEDFVKAFIDHTEGKPWIEAFTVNLGFAINNDIDNNSIDQMAAYTMVDDVLWLVRGQRTDVIEWVEDFVFTVRRVLGFCPFFDIPAYLELVNRSVVDHCNRQFAITLRPEVYALEPIRTNMTPQLMTANSLRSCAVTVFHILHQLTRKWDGGHGDGEWVWPTCNGDGEGLYVRFPLAEGHVTFDLTGTRGLIEHIRCEIEGKVPDKYLKYRTLFLTAAIMFELIEAAELCDNLLIQVIKRRWQQHLVKQAEVMGFSKETLLGASDVLDYHLREVAPTTPESVSKERCGSVDLFPDVDFAATDVHGNTLPAERITGSVFSSGWAKRFGDADLSIGEVMSKMGITTVTFDNGVTMGVF